MPRVFLSYAHVDASAADALERELRARGVDVWRDQASLYSGQRWPKALGEAIAAADAVLLVWSRHSARSEFVELEWATALALKKLLIPWVRDRTPLPPALQSIHAITAREASEVVRRVHASLKPGEPSEDAPVTRAILDDLGEITAPDAKHALEAARAVFQQHGLTVQAGRDIHITIPQSRYPVWVALGVGLLAPIAILLLRDNFTVNEEVRPTHSVDQLLAGFVGGEANEPLAGVAVAIPEFHQAGTTDQNGYYRLVVKAAEQQSVLLLARKEGYKLYRTYATLGNQNMNFKLERAK